MNAEPIDLVWAAHAIALSRDIEEQMTARAAEGFRPLVVPDRCGLVGADPLAY